MSSIRVSPFTSGQSRGAINCRELGPTARSSKALADNHGRGFAAATYSRKNELHPTSCGASRERPDGPGGNCPNSTRVAIATVTTDDAPKAAGPYSQGIVAGGFLFAAGQTPRDPKTGKQVADTFEQAANRVLDNLDAILKAEGLD